MRIDFKQGIVSHQDTFLQINGSGHMNLVTSNRPTTVTLAHKDTDYLFTENYTVTSAWSGPYEPSINYWLYWEFDLLTFARAFGTTNLEPVAQSVEPGSGDAAIVSVTTGPADVGYIEVDGQYVLPVGKEFAITGSTGNDGNYGATSSSFNSNTNRTTIVLDASITNPTADGYATLDIDSDGNALAQVGRMWFDTATNTHYVRYGSTWKEVLRVVACQVTNGATILSHSINATSGDFTGTQIGAVVPTLAGRVMYDESSDPIRRDDRTFFTTEDQFFAEASRIDAIRLESNVARAKSDETGAIPEFSIVAWTDEGIVKFATYEDTGSTVLGVLTETLLFQETGSIVIQGVVTNPSWDWLAVTTVGADLWVDSGVLTHLDPHTTDVVNHMVGMVPTARVLSRDAVVFEQGLGGIGDQGPPGSVEDIPPATTSELGAVTLVTPSSDPDRAFVITDTDPRLTDARTPLAHTHPATDVTFTPGSGLTANNVRDALYELGDTKLNLTGGTMTGFINLHANPTVPLHAVTKQYVDSLVSGLIWLEPISMMNVISDLVTTPPGSPLLGDAYIVPPSATGDWSAIAAGNIVLWDDTQWLDRGPLTSLDSPNIRIGIAMTSATTASGSFTGHETDIAIYDNVGSLVGWEVPVENNAVYVKPPASLYAYSQYAFDGTKWTLFGGGAALTPDNTTIKQTGNVLSTINQADGGVVDASTWRTLIPSDLDLLYSDINHTHQYAYDMSFYMYGQPGATADAVVSAYIVPRAVSVINNVDIVYSYARVAPAVDITFIVQKNGVATGNTITFLAASNTPSSMQFTAAIMLVAGDRLEIVAPGVAETVIEDITMTIVGCATLAACPT